MSPQESALNSQTGRKVVDKLTNRLTDKPNTLPLLCMRAQGNKSEGNKLYLNGTQARHKWQNKKTVATEGLLVELT